MMKLFAEFVLLSIPPYLKQRRRISSLENRLLREIYLRALGASREFLWVDWQNFQTKKINALFPALQKTPFFSKVLGKKRGARLTSLADLGAFPVMAKENVRSRTEEHFLSALPPRWRKRENFTSGSTGEPLHFYQDSVQILLRSWQSRHEIRSIDPAVSFPALILGLGTHTYLNPLGRRFSSNDLESDRIRNGAIYPFLETHNVTLLIGTPTLIERFRHFKELEMKRIAFKVIRSGGERVDAETEKRWRKSFSAKVMDVYGNRECGAIGIQCREGTYHLKPWVTYAEIVDAEGNSLPAGHEGHLLVTSLDNEVMPFVRYATGDRAVISETECECGDKTPQITFHGRDAGEIRLSNGTHVPILKITTMVTKLFHREIRRYQIEEEENAIRFRYQPTELFTEKTKESIKNLFTSIFEDSAQCRLEDTELFVHRGEKMPAFIPRSSRNS